MEPGQIIHIVVTVVAILSAAAAALLCDALRTENARLRRANLELLAKWHHQLRRAELRRDRSREPEKLIGVTSTQERYPSGIPLAARGRSNGDSTRRTARRALAGADRYGDRQQQESRIGGGFGDLGGTLQEAREVAKHLLTATARNGFSKTAAPLLNEVAAGNDEPQTGSAWAGASSGGSTAPTTRRNWGVLLKTQGGQPEQNTGVELGPIPGLGRQKGEVIPFESLHPTQ